MSQHTGRPAEGFAGDFIVPGTCFVPHPETASHVEIPPGALPRDPALRNLYLTAALGEVPRLLGAIDRNPFRPTYGCLDRQYWHYRTSSFPSGMYQEGVLPLALVYATDLPGNRWQGAPRVRELAIAALRFTARSSHSDGSCDDYYPFERALGAAVFSLQAAAEAYRVLQLHDPELLRWFRRRADWLIRHDESGRLANHQALAVLGLLRVGQITGQPEYRDAAWARLERLLEWQCDEGWFEEYGGADPGYQTLTIDCLAKVRKLSENAALDGPLRRAVAFARLFLHPDGSYGGEYGSRGTYHFYPHGMELLAPENPEAADLADGFLRGLAAGKQAAFSDDRMFAHRLGNLIEAYVDWSPTCPAPRQGPGARDGGPGARGGEPGARGQGPGTRGQGRGTRGEGPGARGQRPGSIDDRGLMIDDCPDQGDRQRSSPPQPSTLNPQLSTLRPQPSTLNAASTSQRYLPKARLLVRRTRTTQTVISAARGGVFKHFNGCDLAVTDAGLIVETSDGRVAVSQMHDLNRSVELGGWWSAAGCPQHVALGTCRLTLRVGARRPQPPVDLSVSGPLHWVRFETATPVRQALFHAGMWSVGRWCRTWVRRLLQRRLITGRRECPVRLERTFEFLPEPKVPDGPSLRVTDTIELTDAKTQIRRMAFGTDHEAAYVAASGVYQESALRPWTDLEAYVAELNAKRRVTVAREL